MESTFKTVFIISKNQDPKYWIEKSKTETVFYLIDGGDVDTLNKDFQYQDNFLFLESATISPQGIVAFSDKSSVFSGLDWSEDWLVEEAIIQLDNKLYKVIYWKEEDNIKISKVYCNNKLVEDFDELGIIRVIKHV